MICIKKEIVEKNGGASKRGESPSAVLRGLSSVEARESRRIHGDNRLVERKRRGFFAQFLSNLNDPVIRILLIALGLNLLLLFREADWVETLGIAVSVLLATTVSTLSQMGSEAAFDRLRAESGGGACRVLRDGEMCEVLLENVVVGDVVYLQAGDHIPADGVLVRGALTLDQAAMTGESREVKKRAAVGAVRPQDGCMGEPGDASSLFRGCAVLGGEGQMLVCRVGEATMLGGISREVQEETRESPLKLRLGKLAGQISVLGYVAAALIAAAFLFHALVIDSGFHEEILRMKLTDLTYMADTLLEALMLGLTVIVVAVPEGLPMMIAVVLSANIRRMVKENVLVRKAVGIEAAGSMDLLFTDKTGTLTDGKMSVGAILTGKGEQCRDVAAFARMGEARFALYCLQGRYNSAAMVGRREGNGRRGRRAGTDNGRRGAPCVLGGNATDRALTESVLPYAVPEAEVADRLPFDSARKYALTAVRHGGRLLTLIKGAPERLLPFVSTALDGQGKAHAFSRAAFEEALRGHTKAGERALLLAVCEESVDAADAAAGHFPPLTLLCAVLLGDHIRPEAREAVDTLHRAGIQVVMITGDSADTAAEIARGCGILDGQTDLVLTGGELAAMSDDRLRQVLPRLAVVARALPSDKSRLVRVAQEQERVVGMTGDGINDAPALRRADIGFAMGSGTPVAQDAGDILILDDNLASIVRAVLYGRNIFKSIRKFITLQLTMNFCAVGVSMIGPFIGVNAPVTVVQMLWINLIMDTLGGLAFAGEAPLPSCLAEPPKRRDEPILCRYMVNEILLLGLYTVGLCVVFLKHPSMIAAYRTTPDDLCHLTAFFALFIFASVFNCFNARTDRLHPLAGLSKNRPFLAIMAAVLAVQVAFVYLGGSVLRTMPLTLRELALTAVLALSVLPAEFLRKLLWKWRGRKEKY